MKTLERSVTNKFWFFPHQIAGHVAMWAVRQSPYKNPENLNIVIQKFQDTIRSLFDENEMRQMDRQQVKELLNDHLLCIPEVTQWNNRKNGNQSPFGFVSRYSKPTADNDFIDLDALVMNVCHSLFFEAESEK